VSTRERTPFNKKTKRREMRQGGVGKVDPVLKRRERGGRGSNALTVRKHLKSRQNRGSQLNGVLKKIFHRDPPSKEGKAK